MQDNWKILKNELIYYGIEVIDSGKCAWLLDGKRYQSKIQTKINHLRQEFKINEKILLGLFEDIVEIFNNKEKFISSDKISHKVFIASLGSLQKLYGLILEDSPSIRKELLNGQFAIILRHALNSDIKEFSGLAIQTLPHYKIALDWIYRRNCKLGYFICLLRAVQGGAEFINTIKTARGVAGPWSRLNLPMLERAFPWQDIAEEVEGRETSKETQKRYRQGQEEYNKSDKVGEGYYWREFRNEPYSWDSRFTESPYPQLQEGTWR